MGVTLTDVLLFGKAQLADVDNATLVIYRRNILRWSALGGYLDVIVKGVSPLSLPDAIADSLSYVKAFGGTEQRNLPDNYVERQFIYMMDGSYLLTDIVPTYDCKIEMDFQTTSFSASGSSFIGARSGGPGDGLSLGRSASNYVQFDGFDGNRYTSSTGQFATNTRYKYVWNNQVATLYQGTTTIDTNTFTGTGTTTHPLAINGLNNSGSVVGNVVGIYLYSFKVWNAQGELVANYVPAVQKGTVPVVGFYDTVSKTFKTATAGTFAAGGEAVPTPDTPMDIVSNNGVLKARHQSGLPVGYTLVEGITATGTQYIDTGVKIASTDTVETEFKNSTSTDYGAVYGIYATGESSAFYANTTYYGYDASNSKVNTNVAVDNRWHTVIHDFVNGTLQVDDTTVAFTPFEFANTTNNGLFTRFYNGSYGYFFKGSVKSHKITRNGVVIFNAVSAQRDSDSALGMYDLVSGTFFTNDGTDTFTAGDPVSDPVEIYTDGTVETIEDTIGNTATAEMLLKVGDYQDQQEILSGAVTRNVGIKVLDGTENWQLATATDLVQFYTQSTQGIIANSVSLTSTIAPYGCTVANRTQYDFGCYSGGTGNLCFQMKGSATLTTVSAWTQYLANQYNAGTPVIVIYPLGTPTTESVTGQTLQVQAGDNVLEITQASLNNLELEAEYQAAVSLTIQEVQDANLDPNVQVTIN